DVGRPEHSTALITSRFPIGLGRPSTTPEGDYRPRPGMPQGPGDERAGPKLRFKDKKGYVWVKAPGHPNANRNEGEKGWTNCAPGRNRTYGLLLRRQTLYPL